VIKHSEKTANPQIPSEAAAK